MVSPDASSRRIEQQAFVADGLGYAADAHQEQRGAQFALQALDERDDGIGRFLRGFQEWRGESAERRAQDQRLRHVEAGPQAAGRDQRHARAQVAQLPQRARRGQAPVLEQQTQLISPRAGLAVMFDAAVLEQQTMAASIAAAVADYDGDGLTYDEWRYGA